MGATSTKDLLEVVKIKKSSARTMLCMCVWWDSRSYNGNYSETLPETQHLALFWLFRYSIGDRSKKIVFVFLFISCFYVFNVFIFLTFFILKKVVKVAYGYWKFQREALLENSNEIILFFFWESTNLNNRTGLLITYLQNVLSILSCQKPW